MRFIFRPSRKAYNRLSLTFKFFRNVVINIGERALAHLSAAVLMSFREEILSPSCVHSSNPVSWTADILEKDKINRTSLGERLIIHDEEYSDLDEIISRFLEPLLEKAEALTRYHRFSDGNMDEIGMLVELTMLLSLVPFVCRYCAEDLALLLGVSMVTCVCVSYQCPRWVLGGPDFVCLQRRSSVSSTLRSHEASRTGLLATMIVRGNSFSSSYWRWMDP